MKKILFILKKNECYSFTTYTRRSAGLWNSTRFIVEALVPRGVEADIVEVVDNNDIDREVTKFKPDIVVIEALWVVPEKFPVLQKLHPKVDWYVHLHSHMPFLAIEGISIEWIKGYVKQGVKLIANSKESYEALLNVVPTESLVFLPNVYLSKPRRRHLWLESDSIHIACYGAIRPLKNHLLQAMAAIQFANELGKKLCFYVNASRVELGGQLVLTNLRALFKDNPNAFLIESDWMEPEVLLDSLSTMDIGMQVSLSETFNVVCADYVTAGIPVVASKEIKWLPFFSRATDDSISDIVTVMRRVYKSQPLVWITQAYLRWNSRKAQAAWYQFVK